MKTIVSTFLLTLVLAAPSWASCTVGQKVRVLGRSGEIEQMIDGNLIVAVSDLHAADLRAAIRESEVVDANILGATVFDAGHKAIGTVVEIVPAPMPAGIVKCE